MITYLIEAVFAYSRRILTGIRRRRRTFAALTSVSLVIGLAAVAWMVLGPLDPEPYLAVESSREILDRHGRLMCSFINSDDHWVFERDLDTISPYLVQATIAAEDQRFYRHPGVDPMAVIRAIGQNLRYGRVVSGASTLTMQVVKLTEPTPRTFIGKMMQATRAMRLERRASKDDILQAYLNKVPYGLNLLGCEAAARRYFDKPARELTLAEAALLAGLPKAPGNFLPTRYPDRARVRRDYVLARMHEEGFIDDANFEAATAEPVRARWNSFPEQARHLAMAVRPQLAPGEIVHTALDSRIQQFVENNLVKAVRGYEDAITNAAAIVIDVETAEVLARVGSADFFDTPGGGQVDATRASRSPGSALKPFTYALAMQRQLLYPSEMLYDGRLDYGLYSPDNFDGLHAGLTTADYALKRSLNVPAVAVQDRIGAAALHRFLRDAGLTTLTNAPSHYGLGLTLGNCEVRLDELAAAYAMLANLGEYRPLRHRFDEPETTPRRLLHRGVALAVYDMLDSPLPEEFHRNIIRTSGSPPRAAWKTGTSTGLFDAWAFVFNQHYVVGVWMGNNDARSSEWLVGAKTALPLATVLFRGLPEKSTASWPSNRGDLRETRICARSGLPASRWCKNTRTARLPSTLYLHRTCDMHHPGPDGDPIERWPGSAKGWDLAAIQAPRIRTNDQDSEPSGSSHRRTAALRILEPVDQAEYVLTGESGGDRLRLRTSHDAHGAIHWYLNDRYVGPAQPDAPVHLELEPGAHKLTGMNPDNGAIDTVRFTVHSSRRVF